MTLRGLPDPAGARPTPAICREASMSSRPEPGAMPGRGRPARRSLLAWTLAAAGGALFAFVLFAVDALADLSAAVHLMA